MKDFPGTLAVDAASCALRSGDLGNKFDSCSPRRVLIASAHGLDEDDVERYRTELQECPPGHSDRSTSLSNLANSLRNKFERQGALSDLDEAIELHRAALELRFPGHSDRYMTLNNLAVGLKCRFGQRSIPSDLDEAIELHRAALALCPPSHTDRSASLNNLAVSLQDRFKQRGVRSDLDEAIELHRAALELRPPGHSDRSATLNNIANSLQERFKQRGVQSDLDRAIELHRAALELRPPGCSDRSASLNNLANNLQERFKQRGIPSDLDEATELHRAALQLRPPGHSGRPSSLNNLANMLRERFEQQGILSDLDEAIELYRAALELRPPSHSDRSAYLNNLANSLQERFKQRGVQFDLNQAIELHRAALELRPPGCSDRSASLNNLANSLQERFKQRGIPSDLDEATELHRAALQLRPPGHSDRSASLNNLANSLRDRYSQRGILSDLDEAIDLHRTALELRPPGYSDRSAYLNNLANSLRDRYSQRGIPSDLDEAIDLHRAALALRPRGHPDRSMSLKNLAISLRDRFQQQGLSSDVDEAFGLYFQLSNVFYAASRSDIQAARSWVASAEQLRHGSALMAYQTTLRFMDQHVAGVPSQHHFDLFREATSSLATDAFSCSVRRGALTTAVELVEQGRSVFWTRLTSFHTPLDELSVLGGTGEALAQEFTRLSLRLPNSLDASTEDQSPEIQQLIMEWDDVITRIRMLPKFSRFLLPPLFSDLQEAAAEGLVIILNASQYSCDALIILSSRDPVHVPLDIGQAEVAELSSEFKSLTDRVGTSDHQLEYKIVGVLRQLWDHVVDPIVRALRELSIHRRSRIWWCPTAEFTLLPLHAAGPYAQDKHNLSHFYISSYTSTLAALIRARQQAREDASIQQFAAIGQANQNIGEELLHVDAELDVVAQCLAPLLSLTPPSLSFTRHDNATVQHALDALSRNQWLHLACHGMLDRIQPFDSSFAMRDGRLTIRDIVRSRSQNPDFAFLSACHTSVGDESNTNEAIHLAAAIQFSEFRSIIGPMWFVDDDVAHQVVSAFYLNLVDGPGRLDCTRAAVALHKAVKSLRKKIPLEQQIVFVHVGV
ncbi:TPR-like protein [Suillus clintonianus]|uniref:TPR-like protein n=1 Tax=Suillus clintonianus TaxID=1904413 RepID=UPI001B8733CE|nr:TPR-like protein [Suillus clintonianus]KAG2129604.1 TPR-like protein [Suillus clintonianus]